MPSEDSDATAGAAGNPGASVTDDIRGFGDTVAATYDNSPSHYPQRPQEQTAWSAR